MARSSTSASQAVMLGFFLLLSLFNFASTTPLPEKDDHNSILARDDDTISRERYEAYMKKYFPKTGNYIFYTGLSEDQVKKFMSANAGYNYYDTIINVHGNLNHPWYKAFDEDKDMDDGEEASAAMGSVASGDVLVFGGAKWKTEGPRSYFARHEIEPLHAGLRTGRVKAINHMEKGATKTSQILATEDADGKFSYKNGHKEGDENATGSYGVCDIPAIGSPVLGVIGIIACDAPKTEPKKEEKEKPSKGMALSIVMHTGVAAHGTSAEVINTWKFYTTKAGKAVGSCGETEGKEIKAESDDKPQGGANASLKKPPFPGGTFKLDIEGEKCTYKNNGSTAGKLICPKREISCSADKMKDKEEGSLKCGNNQFLHAVVYCEF